MTPPRVTLFALGTAAFSVAVANLGGLRLNVTDSMQKGLYRLRACGQGTPRDLRAGELVAVSPEAASKEDPAFSFFHLRGYFEVTGAGDDLLLKRVAAVGGARIERRGDRLLIDGLPVSRAASAHVAESNDGETLPKPTLPLVVRQGSVWLSSEHPRGIDSRYFGPVDTTFVRCRAELLWAF